LILEAECSTSEETGSVGKFGDIGWVGCVCNESQRPSLCNFEDPRYVMVIHIVPGGAGLLEGLANSLEDTIAECVVAGALAVRGIAL